MRPLHALALLALGCSSEPTPTTPAPNDAAPVDVAPEDVVVPPGVQLRAHAVNIVDAAAAAEVRAYMLNRSAVLTEGARAFYSHFDDEYDFLYVFTDAPVDGATAAARFAPVRRPAIPGTGLMRATTDTRYPQQHLRGVVGVVFNTVGNGPTLHETLHYWSTYLDARFGFGRDRDTNFGAHWGVASVFGQHGGFDLSTVRCNDTARSMPPCAPDMDGQIRMTAATFGPNANGGDSKPYAPIELYLMGLLPRAEVPSPITVWESAHFVSRDMTTGRMLFEVQNVRQVSMDDIVMVQGERAPAAAEERTLRGAFVCVSDAPLSDARMAALERWAAVFGDDQPSTSLLSFNRATGMRSSMSTRLGRFH